MAAGSRDGCNIPFILSAAYELNPCNIQFNVPRNAEGNVVARRSRIVLTSEPCKIGGLFFLEMTDSTLLLSSTPCVVEQIKVPPIKPKDSVIELYSEAVNSVYYVDTDVKPQDSVILIQCLDKAPIDHVFVPRVAITTSVIVIGCPIDSFPSVKLPEANDLPTGKAVRSTDINGPIIPWRVTEQKRSQFTEVSYAIRWDSMPEVDTHRNVVYKQQKDCGITTDVAWGDMDSMHLTTDIPWKDLRKKYDFITDIRWRMLERNDPNNPEAGHSYDYLKGIVWGGFTAVDNELVITWNAPWPKDLEKEIPWGTFPTKDNELVIPWYGHLEWNRNHNKDVEFEIPWGPIDLSAICCEKYYPPPSCYPIVFNITEPIIPYACQGVVVSVGPMYSNSLTRYCPYQHNTSGRRDSILDPSDLDRLLLKPKDEYDMINLVTVQIWPFNETDVPIHITSMDISTDKDSYLWSFNITIAKDDLSREVIDLLKPRVVNGVLAYTTLLISINQHYWVCMVDGYSESRSFGKKTWNITGRSPSMCLGSPQNEKFSHTFTTENNSMAAGETIIAKILDGSMLRRDDSKWKAIFDRYRHKIHTNFDTSLASDWGFKSGSLTWQDTTQIEAIKSLTDSIGAFIITEPNSIGAGKGSVNPEDYQKLYIRPKYNWPPWLWADRWDIDDTEHCKMISTELAIEVGRTYEHKADYNAVMVMGTMKVTDQDSTTPGAEKGFPVVNLYRRDAGIGFRVYAPDIVDEKLQTTRACAEAGRPVLCETGFWLKHTLKMYSLRFPDSTDETLPPLCWPGDLVKVQEGNSVGGSESEWYGDVESVQISVVVTNNATHVTQTLGLNEYMKV